MATCIQRMQKALTQMNMQLANVISDLSGQTGQAIIRAIMAGEARSAETGRTQRSADPRHVKRKLPRAWRATGVPNCCLSLQQEVEMYDTYQQTDRRMRSAIAKASRQFRKYTLPIQRRKNKPKKKKRKQARTLPHFILAVNCSGSPEWI